MARWDHGYSEVVVVGYDLAAVVTVATTMADSVQRNAFHVLPVHIYIVLVCLRLPLHHSPLVLLSGLFVCILPHAKVLQYKSPALLCMVTIQRFIRI